VNKKLWCTFIRKKKKKKKKKKMESIDDWCQTVVCSAIAQICEDEGFDGGIELSALDQLTALTLRYAAELASESKQCAELARRTRANAADVVEALSCNVYEWSKLKAYLAKHYRTGAALRMPVPPLKVKRIAPLEKARDADEERAASLLKVVNDRDERPKCVPDWMPSLPARRTYVSTPMIVMPNVDPVALRDKRRKRHREAETALCALGERIDRARGAQHDGAEHKRQRVPSSSLPARAKPTPLRVDELVPFLKYADDPTVPLRKAQRHLPMALQKASASAEQSRRRAKVDKILG
jgi:histone H3/H4